MQFFPSILQFVVILAVYNVQFVLAVRARQQQRGKSRSLDIKTEPIKSSSYKNECKNFALTREKMEAGCSKWCKSVADKKYYTGSCNLHGVCSCSYLAIKGKKPEYYRKCTSYCYDKQLSPETQNKECAQCCERELASVKGGSCNKIGPYGWFGKGCFCIPITAAAAGTKSKGVLLRTRSRGSLRRFRTSENVLQ